ncbi:MAG TPA: VWA domain-containing protein [Thermoanaerobaculia bacterium]|nr:VWA domain-containing protein [Thermoanaerobaculia bacterium]
MTRSLSTTLLVLLLAGFPAGVNSAPAAGTPPEGAQDAAQAKKPAPGPRKLTRQERRERLKNLPEKYREFLREVEPIMLEEELATFLVLESDAQRDLYIQQFWTRRDPDPKTVYNEYRERYTADMEEAKKEFRNLNSDRARIFLVRGRPNDRIEINCERYLVPIEIWRWETEKQWGSDKWAVFYQPRVGGTDFRLWQPRGGSMADLEELLSFEGEQRGAQMAFQGQRGGRGIAVECMNGDVLLRALGWVQQNRIEVAKMFAPPEIEVEDVNKILRSVVIANPDAPKMEAAFEARFPGKRGARTAVELLSSVARSSLKAKDLEGQSYYNLDVTGEVLKNDQLFESFHYRYDFPADSTEGSVLVLIERFLRPADYKARLKIVDINSGAEAVIEKDLAVPYIKASEERRQSEAEADETVSRLHTEFRTGESQIRIVPLEGEILTGLQQIETIVTGDKIKGVEFYLDDAKIMTKRRPPFTLELDFGEVPRQRRVKAIALDEKGEFLTGDEIALNVGSDPFRVWIQQPRVAFRARGNVRVEVDAQAPDGRKIDRVEVWLNETRLATLFEKPYVQTIKVPESLAVGYLRAVAYLDDATVQPAEDVVFLNSPDFLEEIDVHLVELPTTVLREGKPVHDLGEAAFRVLDEGAAVKIAKFEHVRNLPLSLGLAVDSSGSMEQKMEEAQKAGAQFLKNVLRPGDKAFVIAFDSQAYTVQKWSRSLADLHAGLSSLRAEETTALYDALVYSLYQFQGVKGQKALVVISDGKDTASKFEFEQALEYARRAAVPIYAIGIGIRGAELDVKYKLTQLAKETGGNTYYIEKASELSKIYADIENELRSQYVIGFYPPAGVKPGGDWREVTVEAQGGTAKTIRGYYP